MFNIWKGISKLKLENIYLITALTFGLIMAVFNPPFAGVPDEHAHYWKAAIVSEGGLWCSEHNNISQGSYNLPDSIKPIKIKGFSEKKMSLSKIKGALFAKNKSKKVKVPGIVCNTMPVGYFPQALGIKIGNIMNVSPLAGFYLARIFNLFLAICFFYLAIKIIPFGKIIILFIGLLPSTIQQMASISYDALHISLVVLFIAYVLNLAVKKGKNKLTDRNIIYLFLLSGIGLNIKLGYFPLIFLVFLIPWKKFGNKKRYFLVVLSLIVITTLIFLGIAFFSGDVVQYKDGVNPISQLKYTLINPFNFLFAVFETIYNRFFFLMETFILKPGWLSHSLPDMLYVFVLTFFAIFIQNEEEEVNISTRQRFIIGACFVFTFLAIFLSLYLGWTTVGSGQVSGVQGRYFLTIVPLLILFFYKSNFRLKSKIVKKNKNILFVIFSATVFVTTFFSMYGMYYDKTGTNAKYIYRGFTTKEERDSAEGINISKSFRQKFISSENDMVGIKIFTDNASIVSPIIFYLKDENCDKIILRKTMAKKRNNIKSLVVKFGLVSNSKNKKYCFTVDNLSQIFKAKVINKNNNNGFSYDGKDVKKTIIYEVIYKNRNRH